MAGQIASAVVAVHCRAAVKDCNDRMTALGQGTG
jgi:hypothetical protein